MARTATALTATFQLLGDKFEHAWFFNRFRCDPLGRSVLVTVALVSETGGILAANGFVLSQNDLKNNRARSLQYLSELNAETDDEKAGTQLLSVPPARVYPVNHINLARMDDVGEIGLFRYSIHTLLMTSRQGGKGAEKQPIPCYPVVMFRSDLSVQLALLKELYNT